MLMIDSLSLLLSKQNPTQAGHTLSQQLRDMVGIGTLAVDKLDGSGVAPARAKDARDVAVGWTLMEISQTRDLAEEASRFLRRETEAEGRYWQDVVKVQRAGWSVCSVPKERHTLGVRFGFSEGTAKASRLCYL
jgi:mediator of RNA polymerase II transcription subunit 17